MRILHTSDWHFGRSLHGQDLGDARALFGRWLIDTVKTQNIQLVLISGDVYDRAIPPVGQINEVMNLLEELSSITQVLLTSGNHDSAARLGMYSHFLHGNIQVCTRVEDIGTAREYLGINGDPGVLVYPIPYLEPDLVRSVLSPTDQPLERTHQAVMDAAMRRIGADLKQRRSEGDLRPAVVMAHAFIVGAAPSDSERNIEVGGVPSVSAETFENFGGDPQAPTPGLSYVALGHLHRPQAIPSTQVPIRYSGSPIAYSFSEAPGDKSAVIIDTHPEDEKRTPHTQRVEISGISTPLALSTVNIPSAHPLVVLTGSMDSILEKARQTDRETYVSLTVTDDARPQSMVSRLRAAYPHALSIIHAPTHTPILAAPQGDLATMDIRSTLADFFSQQGGQPVSAEESSVIDQVVSKVKEDLQ